MKRHPSSVLLAALLAAAAHPTTSFADTLSSSATGSANWSTAGNWQDGSVAISTDDVVIDYSNGATATVLGLNNTQAANSITFGSSTGIPLGAFSLRANTSGTNARALTLTTGNITVDSSVTGDILVGEAGFGTLSIALDAAATGYTFTNNSTSRSLTVSSNLSTGSKTVTFSDAGGGIILDAQHMSPTITSLSGGAAATTVITNNGASGSRTITLNGTTGTTTYAGKITDGANATIGLTKSGIGAEQILTGANNYSGTTTVTGGTLTLAGTNSGTGALTLNGTTAQLNINNAGALSSGLHSLGANGSSAGSGIIDNTSGAAITLTNNPSFTIGAFTFGTAGITDGSHDINFGTGAVTNLGGGTPAITFLGTGSTLTFGGVYTGLHSKGLVVNGAGNTVSLGSLLIGQNGVTGAGNQSFSGSGNIEITGVVSNGSGVSTGGLNFTGASGSGKLTLKGANTYNGATTVATAGAILNIQHSDALGTADGTAATRTFLNAGTSLQLQGGITVGDEAITIAAGTYAAGATGAIQNVSGVNNYGGSITSTTGGTTISSDAGTLNLTGATISFGGSQPNFILTGAGNGTIANSISQANGLVSKTGTGTWTLSGTNNNGSSYAVSNGTLQFAKTASLYNDTPANWTAARIRVASGGTIAFNVGGTGEFTTGNVTTLLTNLASSSNATTNGMAAGSSLGFDTTNAGSGTFTIADVIANTTGTAGGARGLTKLGTNELVLSGANTYSGATTIDNGTLALGANNAFSANSAIDLNTGGTVDLKTFSTSAASLDFASGSTLKFGLGAANNPSALLALTGALAKTGSGVFTLDFSGSGEVGTYNLVSFASTAFTSESEFTIANLGGGLTGLLTLGANSLNLTVSAIPEPSAFALLAGAGVLLLAAGRRTRRSA